MRTKSIEYKHSKDAEKIEIKKNNTKSFQRKNFSVRAFPEDSLFDLISAEFGGMRGKAEYFAREL